MKINFQKHYCFSLLQNLVIHFILVNIMSPKFESNKGKWKILENSADNLSYKHSI